MLFTKLFVIGLVAILFTILILASFSTILQTDLSFLDPSSPSPSFFPSPTTDSSPSPPPSKSPTAPFPSQTLTNPPLADDAPRRLLSEILAKEKARKGICRKTNQTWAIQLHGASWNVLEERTLGCQDYCHFSQPGESPSVNLFHCVTSSVYHSPDQKGVMVGIEPRTFEGGPQCFTNPERLKMDVLGTYNLDSNLPFLYFRLGFWDFLSITKIASKGEYQARKGILFISSNCVPGRTETMGKLMALIPIEARGRCHNNAPMIERNAPLTFYSEYKLTISFDKTNDQDYVSEKLFDPFMYNSLPVYFGSPTAKYLLPKGSFVDAQGFGSLEDLALYLYVLLTDYNEWKKYFAWREEIPDDLRDRMEHLQELGYEHPKATCRICDCLCDQKCSGSPDAGIGLRDAAH